MDVPFNVTVPSYEVISDTEYGVYHNSTANETGTTAAAVFIPTIKQPVHMIVLYSIAYSVVFLLGITGNTLVVSVVYRNPRMHNVTNYFIVNLAIADILVSLFCLPFTLLSNLYSGWRFGAVMCKATPFLQGVAVSASVNTLAAIAFDRYLAICHTLEFRMTRKIARLIIICIWVAAAAIMTPWAIYYQEESVPYGSQILYICDQYWPNLAQEKLYFLAAIFLTCYSLPLILISSCYMLIGLRVWNRNAPGIANSCGVIQKSKVKVIKMLIVVVILFTISWLPLYAVQFRRYFGPPMDYSSPDVVALSQIVVPIAQWLGSSNSCVNPLIYCFFSKKYRTGFKDMMRCCGLWQDNHLIRTSSAYYQSVYEGSSPNVRNGGNAHHIVSCRLPGHGKPRESTEVTFV